jgi:hypothetical protein
MSAFGGEADIRVGCPTTTQSGERVKAPRMIGIEVLSRAWPQQAVAGSLNRNLATDFHHLVVGQFEDI